MGIQRWKYAVVSVLVGLLTLAIPSVGHAQTSNGTIAGTVTDRSGAVVPGAQVKAISTQYGTEHIADTDSTGGYHLEALPPGRYAVTMSATGFDDLTINNIEVKASLTVTANGTLEVSAVKHTVIVEASAGQELQTETGELSGEISSTEVRNLPMLSLNPVELVLTEPGVQDANGFGFSNGIDFSVNGTRPRANNFLIDGQDNNDNGIAGQAFQTTNYGLIQEVTILTNSYSAEFGRGGGSVTNEITRRGSNDFHGEAWELNRNSAFAAIPAQDTVSGAPPTKNPFDNENTFGFDFGGPIKHNKLFVFGTAQWDREHEASQGSILIVPTAAGLATLNALAPAFPNAAILVQSLNGVVASSNGAVDQPLGPGLPNLNVNTFQRSVTTINLDRQWAARLDWNATPSDTVSGLYRRDDGSFSPDFGNYPFVLPLFDALQFGAAQGFTGVWTHTFSPAALNEFRFSYSNIDFTFGFTNAALSSPLSGLANFEFGGAFGSEGFPELGLDQGNPQGRGHKSYQYQDAISWTKGRHSFKFGGDIDYVKVDDLVPFDSRGSIVFEDGGGFSDLGNFIENATGQSGTISKVFGNPEVQPLETIYAPYIQDTWHVKSNLTVDLGLRYEYWGTPGNIAQYPSINLNYTTFGLPGASFPGIAASKQKPDENNFGPRVGFAYTPGFWKGVFGDNKTVLRAGWGIFYDGIFTNIIDNTIATSPNATGLTIVGGPGQGQLNATGALASAAPVPSPFAAIETINSHLLNPLTDQWNVDIQRELPGNFVVTAAYVGTRGEHLFANQDLNEINPLTGVRLNPNFGPVDVRDNAGDSIYHSAQLKVERRFSRGFLFRGAYTYSKLIDDSSEVFVTTGLSSYSQNLLDQAGDRGLSSYDRRHRGVMTYVWDVPGFNSHSNFGESALSYVTSGWQWSGTFTMQTGSPEDIHDGFDANGDGHAQDRPSIGNASLPQTSRGIDGEFLGLTSTPGTYFDIQSCFLAVVSVCNPQPASAFHYIITTNPAGGNVGRNTYIGPGQVFYDTSVQRSFKIPMFHMEQSQLTFRTEFFNAFNHPNYFTDTPGGGPDIHSLLSNDFLNTAETVDGGREIRFWLKYQF